MIEALDQRGRSRGSEQAAAIDAEVEIMSRAAVYTTALTAGVCLCAMATLLAGPSGLFARASAAMAGVALIAGAEPLARSAFRRTSAVLLLLLCAPIALMVHGLLQMTAIAAVLGHSRSDFWSLAKALGLVGSLAMVALGSSRWASWRLRRVTDESRLFEDPFNDLACVAVIWMLTVAGMLGVWLSAPLGAR